MLTKDLGGNSKCSEFTAEICRRVQDLGWSCSEGATACLIGAPPPRTGWSLWSCRETVGCSSLTCLYVKKTWVLAVMRLCMWRGRGLCNNSIHSQHTHKCHITKMEWNNFRSVFTPVIIIISVWIFAIFVTVLHFNWTLVLFIVSVSCCSLQLHTRI